MMRIVLASSNAGKLAELRTLLAPLAMEIIGQGELGIAAAPEERITFVENALDKARHASLRSSMPAIADDSGLVVRALDGAPGIRSARYAGEDATDQANNARLLRELAGASDRSAHFYCVLVFVRHAEDPAPLIALGRWEGSIGEAPEGRGGFGYDPLFRPLGDHRSAAQMPAAEKNRHSHRGQATAELVAQLRTLP
jgi:XTP/dITP diphosphohydrolase